MWKIVQAAIVGVPVYWLVTDPEARQDPQLLVGVPMMMILLAYTVTAAGTAGWDATRSALAKLRFGKKGQAQGKSLRPGTLDGRIGEVAQHRRGGRVGQHPR